MDLSVTVHKKDATDGPDTIPKCSPWIELLRFIRHDHGGVLTVKKCLTIHGSYVMTTFRCTRIHK
jgi:hypothetical protein